MGLWNSLRILDCQWVHICRSPTLASPPIGAGHVSPSSSLVASVILGFVDFEVLLVFWGSVCASMCSPVGNGIPTRGPDLLPATQSLLQLGVQMLPNPAHVRVGGFRVTLSSSDVLSPIVRELVLRPKENKIEEALRALLHQRTLFPAVPREPAHVSEARSAALDFPDGIAPDLCVFPSVLGLAKAFVDDSVFLNSGMLCRGALGSFAEINIAAAVGTPLRERVKVDVQKLVS